MLVPCHDNAHNVCTQCTRPGPHPCARRTTLCKNVGWPAPWALRDHRPHGVLWMYGHDHRAPGHHHSVASVVIIIAHCVVRSCATCARRVRITDMQLSAHRVHTIDRPYAAYEYYVCALRSRKQWRAQSLNANVSRLSSHRFFVGLYKTKRVLSCECAARALNSMRQAHKLLERVEASLLCVWKQVRDFESSANIL